MVKSNSKQNNGSGAKSVKAQSRRAARARAQRARLNRFAIKSQLPTAVNAQMVARAGQSRLALAMMLPDEYPVRFPTTDAPRTSLMGVKDQMTITTADSAGNPPGWNRGDLLIAFYGQPSRLFTAFTSLTTGTYTPSFGSSGTGWTLYPSAIAGTIEPNTDWPLSGLTINTGTPPHGQSMPFAVSQSTSFVFLNTGDTLVTSITFTSSGLTANANFIIMKYQGLETEPAVVAEPSLTMTAGGYSGVVYTSTAPGHYMVKFVGMFISAGSITSAIASIWSVNCNATVGWLIRGMGDIDVANSGDHNLALNARRNASALLVTNTTSLLNRQGTVLAARVRDFDPTSMTPQILGRAGEKYAGDAAKGVYTFVEFSENAQNFRSYVTESKSPYYPLDDEDYYHFIQISCPTASTAANTYTLTVATTLEFKSEVARYSKEVASGSWAELIEARRLVNSTPDWFFENPDHMKRAYEIAKRALSAGMHYAPLIAQPAAQIIKTLNPATAPTVDLIARLLAGLK